MRSQVRYACYTTRTSSGFSSQRRGTRSRTAGVQFKKGKGSDGSLAECQVLVNEGQTGEKAEHGGAELAFTEHFLEQRPTHSCRLLFWSDWSGSEAPSNLIVLRLVVKDHRRYACATGDRVARLRVTVSRIPQARLLQSTSVAVVPATQASALLLLVSELPLLLWSVSSDHLGTHPRVSVCSCHII